MRILYISSLSSRRLIDNIHKATGGDPGYAAQKFNRLVVEGLIQNGLNVQALSVPPITQKESKKKWISLKKESENSVLYKYIPFVNVNILKYVFVLVYTFSYVLFWCSKYRKEGAIVCDVLSISSCLGALLASRLAHVKSVAIITDIYSQMVGKEENGWNAFLKKTAGWLQKVYTSSFTHYVLLTEAMNNLVNVHARPYVVIEGLVPIDSKYENVSKETPRTVLYAGGLHERYGIRVLIEAFKQIKLRDVQLVLYGNGPMAEELKKEDDPRIVYRGVASNKEIVEAEQRATLLVNPRFTNEEYTKFSFPSKNMEYMASGSPLLTTRLPGMPKEYEPYVFLFEEESIEDYAKKLFEVLSLPEKELQERGRLARQFVLKEKNNKTQANKIIQLIN